MKVAISQSNYIPWKGYFDMIAMVDVFVLYDDVQYTKNDWRNRNRIMSKQGPMWITIPVQQERLEQRICDTKIASSKWAVKHWKTLQANYGKAPYFGDYAEIFQSAYQRCAEFQFLSDINRHFIEVINGILGIETRIEDSRSLQLDGDRSVKLLDAVKSYSGSTYVSGPAAKSYLDIDLFSAHKIEVKWMDYGNYKPYPQLGAQFDHAVTVLDLIFNLGGQAREYMKY